jgi:acyl dehydratase
MSESPETPVIRQRGLWFEELETGITYKHAPGRTIGEADNTLFSTLTMNPQALHLDAAFSASTEFGERLVNSLLTMSVLVGLSAGHLTQATIVANLGFTDVRFPAPVRAGDTIYGETTVTGKRLSSSRPGQGIVTFQHTARNQHGEVVAVLTRNTLMLCTPGQR